MLEDLAEKEFEAEVAEDEDEGDLSDYDEDTSVAFKIREMELKRAHIYILFTREERVGKLYFAM